MVVIIGAIIGCTISLSGLGYLFGIPMYKDYIKFRDESRKFTKDTNDKLAIIKKNIKVSHAHRGFIGNTALPPEITNHILSFIGPNDFYPGKLPSKKDRNDEWLNHMAIYSSAN